MAGDPAHPPKSTAAKRRPKCFILNRGLCVGLNNAKLPTNIVEIGIGYLVAEVDFWRRFVNFGRYETTTDTESGVVRSRGGGDGRVCAPAAEAVVRCALLDGVVCPRRGAARGAGGEGRAVAFSARGGLVGQVPAGGGRVRGSALLSRRSRTGGQAGWSAEGRLSRCSWCG